MSYYCSLACKINVIGSLDMDKSEGGEFYYPNELVEGSLEWQNASYKPTDSELQSIDLDFQYYCSSLHLEVI